MRQNLLLCLAFLLLSAAPALFASEETERAAVGQTAPAIDAQSSAGESFASSQVLAGDKRIVLVFFRGAW